MSDNNNNNELNIDKKEDDNVKMNEESVDEKEPVDTFDDIPDEVKNDTVDAIRTRTRMIDNEIRVKSILFRKYSFINLVYRCLNLNNYV